MVIRYLTANDCAALLGSSVGKKIKKTVEEIFIFTIILFINMAQFKQLEIEHVFCTLFVEHVVH